MSDDVEVVVPAPSDLLTVARLAAATVAARAGFDVEEIEDLRLAVEELCLSVIDGRSGRLRVRYSGNGAEVKVRCSFEMEGGDSDRPSDGPQDELPERILDALVDEHGRDGETSGWLQKRGGQGGT
jgi:serine/threonine-protein kinase RsbW